MRKLRNQNQSHFTSSEYLAVRHATVVTQLTGRIRDGLLLVEKANMSQSYQPFLEQGKTKHSLESQIKISVRQKVKLTVRGTTRKPTFPQLRGTLNSSSHSSSTVQFCTVFKPTLY